MATNLVAKMGQNYLHPTLIAPAFRNGMGYRYLNVRVNSANDASILCEKFREIRYSNSRDDRAYLYVRQVRHGNKTGAFSRISPDVLDRFSHMKALHVQMMVLYLIFHFFKGRCHGNQIILRKCCQR